MPKDQIDLSKFHRLLNAGPVVLVTAQAKGRFNIHAAPWATPLSMRPPLVGVAVPPPRLTHDLVKRGGEFVLNVPSYDLLRQVQQIAAVSGHDVDKLKATGLHLAEPKVVAVPLLAECIGHLECGLLDAYEIGDHTLFVGEVLAAWVERDAFEEFWLLRDRDLKPLHHLGGPRYAVLEAPFVPGQERESPEDESSG
jgi:flavin reductase (DIM6/NTAB) family NADH-FMN oxidoreductase RutF